MRSSAGVNRDSVRGDFLEDAADFPIGFEAHGLRRGVDAMRLRTLPRRLRPQRGGASDQRQSSQASGHRCFQSSMGKAAAGAETQRTPRNAFPLRLQRLCVECTIPLTPIRKAARSPGSWRTRQILLSR